MIANATELKQAQDRFAECLGRERSRILVCAGTGCIANGSLQVYEALQHLVRESGSLVDVDLLQEDQHAAGSAVIKTGCRGFCAAGPLVHVEPQGVLYTHVQAADALEIVQAAEKGEIVRRLVYRDPVTDEPYAKAEESPFYNKQVRQVLAHCGNIDPERIE
jgi:NADH-quinone oxidoreductase subunit F